MISIIIPVYNEENRLEGGIKKVFEFIKKSHVKYEVIVVDDGSKDSTFGLLLSLRKKYPIKLISHQNNLGKGAAVKKGIDNALGDLVLFSDIDLSVPIEFVDKFQKAIAKRYDIVIGTRIAMGSTILKKQSFLRELLGGGFTILSNLLLGVRISDYTCGFKLFRKKAAKKIFSKQLIKRWAFDSESLFIAKKYNFCIKEVPVQWYHVEGSKVSFPKDLIVTFINLFQIRFNDFKGRYD